MKVNSFGFIYVIENDVNNKLYVGRTLDLKKRKRTHFSKSSRTWAIKAAIEKHGAQHFDFVILEGLASEEELNKREVYWIEKLNTLAPFGYNLKQGGKSGFPTEIARERMRAAHQGVSLSPEHRRAIGLASKGHKVSAEAREKISIASRGRLHSEETRTKMSRSHTGKHVSLETRLRMSEAHKGKSKGPWSEERKQQRSRDLMGRKVSLATRQKMSESQRIRHRGNGK